MANLVFTPCAGVVEIKRDADCGGPALTMKLDDEALNGESTIGIVTGVSVAFAGNYQFVHTVNNFVYFYAFGDRIGTLNITGIGFIKTCNGSKGQLLDLYDKYVEKRAAKRGGVPSKLTLSTVQFPLAVSRTFLGFLTGMSIDIKTSDAIGTVGYWNLKFDVLLDDGTAP